MGNREARIFLGAPTTVVASALAGRIIDPREISLNQSGCYKRHLANCDLPRRDDLDGRGSLSEEELVALTRFFLEVCM